MSKTPNARDKRVAEDVGADRTLLCCASGCPNRWCVDGGNGHCCSAHAWADRHLWPQITQEQLDAETDRALAAAAPKARVEHPKLSPREKRDILLRLRDVLERMKRTPRAWIDALERRVSAGQQLSAGQKHALDQVRASAPHRNELDEEMES